MPPIWIGLVLAFASALVTNTAYSLERDAAAQLPPLSPRRPFRSARFLLGDRTGSPRSRLRPPDGSCTWRLCGWRPLRWCRPWGRQESRSWAFATAHGHSSRLVRREQLAVVLAVTGLTLLALSLAGTTPSDQHPPAVAVVIWFVACGDGAVLLIARPPRLVRAASRASRPACCSPTVTSPSVKLVGYGGLWLAALATLIAGYAAGTSMLQWAYQQGDALTAADMATMATNAIPIAAGFVVFGETLPHGIRAVLQVAAFACPVASAVALGFQQAPQVREPTLRADCTGDGSG